MKIEFKEFSDEPEDWNTWSKGNHAKLSALGYADALMATVVSVTTTTTP